MMPVLNILLLLVLCASTISGHAVFIKKEVKSDSYAYGSIRIGHTCPEADATWKTQIWYPSETQVTRVKGQQVAGFHVEVQDEYLSIHGLVDYNKFKDYKLTFKVSNETNVGDKIYFPTIQYCTDGNNLSWTMIPESEEDRPRYPAPYLIVEE